MPRKPPPRHKTIFSHVTTCNKVQERLRSRYGVLQDWKLVSAEFGVSPAMAFRVATSDYEPRDNAIRGRLGLPIMAPAPVCPACGIVHTKRCPATGKPRKPRVEWRKRAAAATWAALALMRAWADKGE